MKSTFRRGCRLIVGAQLERVSQAVGCVRPESKPVQITQERCHVLGSTGGVDQPRRRVEHGPQSVYQPIRDAGECGIAVVKAR